MMASVTTQAPSQATAQPPTKNIAEHIKKLTFDLTHHAGTHSVAEVFDPNCGECIYWASKIAQHPETWTVDYAKKQAGHLRQVQMEVANHCIKTINDAGYSLNIKAREWTAQEYLQAVMAQ